MRVELGEIEAGVVKSSAGLLSNCAVKLRDTFLVAYCQAVRLTISLARSIVLPGKSTYARFPQLRLS